MDISIYNPTITIALFGMETVGKRTFINNFCNYETTKHFSLFTNKNHNVNFCVHIYDSVESCNIIPDYCILMYSSIDIQSLAFLYEYCTNIPSVLVANKRDMDRDEEFPISLERSLIFDICHYRNIINSICLSSINDTMIFEPFSCIIKHYFKDLSISIYYSNIDNNDNDIDNLSNKLSTL
jgi:GTPase SAR1 family protein